MIKAIIIIFLIIFPYNLYASNIVVVNIDELINSNKLYINILKRIETNQTPFYKKFKDQEEKIDQLLDEINSSKLILSEDEINNMINEYNIKLNNFGTLIDRFNNHYQNEIANIRKILLKEIIVLLEKYAKNNQIDLILDSNSYLIASNAINITKSIRNELDNINIELDFKDFDNN